MRLRIIFFFFLLLVSVHSFSQVNLSQGLVAYYPFNGNPNDVSGNGNHGTVRNGASLTTDRFGTANSAYHFDGIDDFIQIPNSPSLNYSQAMTIVTYFKPERNGLQTIIGKIDNDKPAGTQFQIAMDYAPQPGILFGVNAANNGCIAVASMGSYVSTGNPVRINEWYCAVSTFDNGIMRFFVNGVLIQTVNAGFTTMNACTNATVQIGRWWSGDPQQFKGSIDDVRLYDRALNQQEITALCPAQPCSDWLKLSNQLDGVKIGDLDISGNQLTVEATFNRTAPWVGNYQYAGNIVSKHRDPNDCNYLLRPGHAEITTTNGFFSTAQVCNFQLNKTYHVAMVYNGSSLKFYRNGYLMNEVPASGNLVLNDYLTTIGEGAYPSAPYPNSESMVGLINEVRIWNVPRTQSQIRSFMNTSLPAPTTQTGLLAYYVFDDLINKQGNAAWNGTLRANAAIRQPNVSCAPVTDSCEQIVQSVVITPSFTAPDTICINNPLNITNTTTGASSYFWNFCVGNLHNPPVGNNMGNVGSTFTSPVYIDYVEDNGNYYGFMTDNYTGRLMRLDFGTSLLNTPTVTDFGTLGGVLKVGIEGVQIIKNEGKWYVLVVGGEAPAVTPFIAKVELGANITNPTPVATNWGNLGNMSYPHDLYVFNDGPRWYGLTVNTNNSTITRFDFSTSFDNVPAATNFGNIGGLSSPTGLHAINDNGSWHAFVTNAGSATITRLDFGNSLLNVPTAQNIGNPGNTFTTPWDITVIKFCGELLGYVIDGNASKNSLVKLDFKNNVRNAAPIPQSFGNIGNLNFPHCLSKIFRAGSDIYTFVPNVLNSTLTRLQFVGCSNASVPNSNLENPPPIRYNTPGTYNINLTIDDGLPSQNTICKQVVVLPPPVAAATRQERLCTEVNVLRIGTGTKQAKYLWNTGATTDSIDVTAGGMYWVDIDRFGCKVADTFKVTAASCLVVASFTTPDTVCINNPVTVTNTSNAATSYFWNFCVASIDQAPIATNIGNPGGNLRAPVFMDYIIHNNNYYGFSTNYSPGGLIRYDFGNSLLNTPTTVNLGNFGGIIPPADGAEGIQVVQNEGKWYIIIVGGNPATPGGVQPRILKIELGTDPANPSPTVTNWGNIGNMLQPIDLHLFKEGNAWYGFTVNSENNTITRFNFTNSFNNTPTAVNLGNLGNLAYPTGIYVINDKGTYRVFVTNGDNNSRSTSSNFSITRLDFGNSLLNTPMAVNLGNPGNVLRHPRDLTIMKSCDQIIAFAVNGAIGSDDIVKLNFNNDLGSIPTGTSLGNLGNLNFPHSISRLFRVNEDIYGFVTNVANNTITRLRFPGCNNASIPNSNLPTPPPVTYNTPGTYNINLTVDDGLSSQSAFCKQVVVLAAPVATVSQTRLCLEDNLIRIGTATKYAQYLWNTGATTDSIDVTTGGTYWVQINRFGCSVTDTIKVTAATCRITHSFTAPDTVCINNAVNIANTTVGATSFYWNFCVGNLQAAPVGNNMGNIGGTLTSPVYIDYVLDNGNYYGFMTDNHTGNLIRLDFGNSLLNTPTSTNFGNFGGALGIGIEGVQIVKNEGKWYVITVGGDGISSTPYIAKTELGANITNPNPVTTRWGNLGNLLYPHDLYIFNDGPRWYGLTVNYTNNSITRFDFSTSFNNPPVATNLGNLGGLNGPTGLHAINDNGTWHAFVTNAVDATITRLDFGTSLLNTPTAQNIGNPGNVFTTPWDITVIKFCGELLGYVIDAAGSKNSLVKLDFQNNIRNASPTAQSFGNIGNLDFPHCLSKIFRAGSDIYTFVPNVRNSSLTRLQFVGCNNASIPNSSLENPPPIRYNSPGTYNINLTIDDGLPSQNTICKQVVVLAAPAQAPTQVKTLCAGETIKIGTNKKLVTYLWNTGAMTDSISVTAPGTYWVEVNSFGCKATDTIKVVPSAVSEFGFKQDVCNPYQVSFVNAGSGTVAPWWELGDGTIITGNTTVGHTYGAFGDYKVRFSVSNGVCTDTVTKIIPIWVTKEDVVLTPDTVICIGSTKQLRAKQGVSYCWSPATYLDNPSAQNPVTSTPRDITYYLNTEIVGANLVLNGDFSTGNNGFTSQYKQTITNVSEAEYNIGSNPQSWGGTLNTCRDHTTGNGNMMLVRGAPGLDVNVWTQAVAVTPNTNYVFSTWIQSLSNGNAAALQFSINGKAIGNPIISGIAPCTWTSFNTSWNSGSSTTAIISIINKSTQVPGSLYALDDISFAPVYIRQDSVVVKVEKPVVKTNADTTICTNRPVPLSTTGAAIYSWTPATNLSNPSIPNPIATPGANTQYIVTGTTIHGCQAKDTIQINLFARPVMSRTPDTLVCRNTSFPLHINGADSYAWSPGSHLVNANSGQPVAMIGTQDVKFLVDIRDTHGCEYKDSVQVAVRPYPVFSANGTGAVCAGDSRTLRAQGGDSYQWTPAAFLQDPLAATTIATPDVTTTFSVHIQDNTCGFDSTIALRVTVNPKPTVTANKANDVNCNTPTAQLTASGASRYAWTPSLGLDRTDRSNPIAAIDTTTVYKVEGTNQFGCTASAFVEVKVTKDGIPTFVVPNAFTPNGDNNNDCFGIRRWGNAQVHEFTVYNRWGQRVFHASNPNQCWDGTFNGKPQDAGGYVYIIRAHTLCGEVVSKGVVMLVR